MHKACSLNHLTSDATRNAPAGGDKIALSLNHLTSDATRNEYRYAGNRIAA